MHCLYRIIRCFVVRSHNVSGNPLGVSKNQSNNLRKYFEDSLHKELSFFLFRWVNALDPKIDKGPWTPQQDRKLKTLISLVKVRTSIA